MIGASGWHYDTPNTDAKDARKLVTLRDHMGMVWVGIRAWHNGGYWLNGSDPEAARVLAWRDLPEPASGRWSRGQLVGDGITASADSAAEQGGAK